MKKTLATLSLLFLSFSIFSQEKLSLDQVIQLAVENNYDLKKQAASLAMANAQYKQIKGVLDFEVGAQGKYSLSQNPVDKKNPSYYSYVVANDNIESYSSEGNVFLKKLFSFGLESRLSYSIQRNKNKYHFDTKDKLFLDSYDDLINPTYNNKGYFSLDLNMSLLKAFNNSPVAMELKGAETDIERMNYLLEDSISKIIINTSKSYWDYFISYKNYEYLKELDSVLETRHSNMNSLISAGLRSQNDMLAVQVNMLQNKTRIKSAEVALRNAKMQLLEAIGYSSSQLPGYPDVEFSQSELYMGDIPSPEVITDELVNRIFSSRNDLAALQKAVDSAELKMKVAKANSLPDLNVGLSLGTSGTNYTNNFGNYLKSGTDNVKGVNVTGSVSCSIKIGNESAKGAMEKAKADYDIAYGELCKAKNNLKLELTNAAENMNLYKTMIDDSKTVLELRKTLYENEQTRFNAGYITVDDLSLQDQNYLEAQVSYYQTLSSYLNSVLEYKYYSGQMLTLK